MTKGYLPRATAHERANVKHGDLSQSGTIRSYVQLFLLSCKVENLSPKTITNYDEMLAVFEKYCGEHNVTTLDSVDTDLIRGYILERAARVKPVSVHDYYRVVKRWLNWLLDQEVIQVNPCARIKTPKFPKKIIPVFTQQQLQDMLTLCNDGTKTGVRNRAIILMLLDTGLRLKECALLKTSDVDLTQETITVMGKGAKQRRVRLGRIAQKALLKYLISRGDDLPYLWLTEEKEQLQPKGIQAIIRRLKVRAGIHDVRCSAHTFRHTFAINYLRNGGDVFTLQYILGHSTLDMTQRYVASLKSEDAINCHKKWSPVDNMKWRIKWQT